MTNRDTHQPAPIPAPAFTWAGYLLRVLLLAGAYYAAGRLGLLAGHSVEIVSAVWPASGIALAVLLLGGLRLWPGVAIGAAAVILSTDAPDVIMLPVAIGNTLEAVAGAWLFRRVTGGVSFQRLLDVFHFILWPALLACSIAATIGTLSVVLSGAGDWIVFNRLWRIWWFGDVLGTLVVTPFILTLSRPSLTGLFSARTGEAILTGVLLVVSAVAVFNPWLNDVQDHYAVAMLVFPAVMWSALRFGPVGASSAAMLLSALAISGTAMGYGPFARDTLADRMLFLQFFIFIVAITGLAVATYMVEREATEHALRQANAAKDRFLAVLSHELRTPLSPVLTIASSLEHDPAVPQALREDMELIRRNIELEVRLIDDLLDLTRVSRGKLALRLQEADVHETIRQALVLCQGDLSGRDLRLRAHLDARNPHVRGDGARLQQVFWNLAKNAIKFTPRGEVTVTTSNVQVAGQERLRIEIADTGVGIEPAVMNQIFRPFEQGRARAWHSAAGLGLGLAIGREIVQAHNGSMEAHSEGVGRGARFVVELPSIVASAPHASLAGDDGEQAARVLLVEDHDDTRRAMHRLLKRFGYEVEVADSVLAAIRASDAARQRGRPFDLLISDLGLPDGSGTELMERLLHSGPMLGIALSGYGMEEDVARSRRSGFSAHLTKPVNVARLQVEIERVLRGQQSSETLKSSPH